MHLLKVLNFWGIVSRCFFDCFAFLFADLTVAKVCGYFKISKTSLICSDAYSRSFLS